MKKFCFSLMIVLCVSSAALGDAISRDPYIGAIAMDANTGTVLWEDGADRPGYPASMLKLMTLFIVLDDVKVGRLRLTDMVRVTKEAADMGGTQVYLDTRERFSVDDLLYALIISSANDAAMALAIHVGGSREAFVERMNRKARELKLSPVTRFRSPHGLPPSAKDADQRPDMTTPRDFAKLSCALINTHPESLVYTSTTFRQLRANTKKPFDMRSHNRLLGRVEGCDGLKTGYFKKAGYSIAATAQRDGARVVVVVMGSREREHRDAVATECLNRALPLASRTASPSVTAVPALPPAQVEIIVPDEVDETPAEEAAAPPRSRKKTIIWILVVVAVAAVFGRMIQRRRTMYRR